MHCPGPARGVVLWLGFCDRLEALPSATRRQNASEPGANLAPRLDRREQDLPWAHPHFSISVANGQRHHVFVERGVVCSRVVSDASRRRSPQARCCSAACRRAAQRWRRWQASQRYRSTERGQERRREQSRRYRERQRQQQRTESADEALPREGQRQGLRAMILPGGPAIDRVVMSFSRSPMNNRASDSVVWPADWRYVACWIVRRAIGRGVGAGVRNV